MTLSEEQVAEWCNDAERDVLTTRAPSGYYPTARIFRLIEDRQRLIKERDRHGPCICDTGPGTDGPDEFCPRHGRPYDDALDYMGRIIAHEREQAQGLDAGNAAIAEELRGTVQRAEQAERERDEWKRRRDIAVETCRFRHQDGLTTAEWHVKICAAAEFAQRLTERLTKAEAREAALRDRLTLLAQDLLSEVDWSGGRSDYGDNAAYELCVRRLRAALGEAGEQ